jgi:hypothetical protein
VGAFGAGRKFGGVLRVVLAFGDVKCAPHLPIGHRSVAMRNLAQVEQPHFSHLPVPLSAAECHHSQARQIDFRSAKISGDAVLNPD